MSERGNSEIAHGRMLAEPNAEDVWGWDSPAGRLRARRRAALIARGARLGPGVSALEIGCGTGLFTRHLAPSVEHLTAVDASPEVLAINRARVSADNVEYVEADLFSWTPSRRYDAVFFSFWLSHVPEDRSEAFWKTVADALEPGGAS